MKKLMVIAALLVFMTGSAHAAAEWNFYGSARVSTFYGDYEQSPFDGTGAQALGLGVGPDTTNYEQSLNGNARIGANVKVSDSLTGRFEYGALGGSANMRILWGEWNFGAGSLGVGQNYTPLLMPYSNQVYNIAALNKGDHNMSTFGMLYGSREAQIRLKFGNFQIAAVQPRTTVTHAAGVVGMNLSPVLADGVTPNPFYTGVLAAPDVEVKFPNIQAKYKIDFDNGHINIAGGYQNFDVKENGQNYDVTSYVLAVGGRLNVGKAYFKGNVWGGQNVGNLADILVSGSLWSSTDNLGSSNWDGAGWGLAQWDNGTAGGQVGITDNEAMAGLLVAGYEIRRGLYIEAGYGYVRTELDGSAYSKDDAETMYLQSTIFLAEGVFITPEIGRCDMKQTGQPDIVYFGAKWQINF